MIPNRLQQGLVKNLHFHAYLNLKPIDVILGSALQLEKLPPSPSIYGLLVIGADLIASNQDIWSPLGPAGLLRASSQERRQRCATISGAQRSWRAADISGAPAAISGIVWRRRAASPERNERRQECS